MDNGDPRTEFIKSLSDALGESGSIVVYNEQFESQRLWELASWLPTYTDRIRVFSVTCGTCFQWFAIMCTTRSSAAHFL